MIFHFIHNCQNNTSLKYALTFAHRRRLSWTISSRHTPWMRFSSTSDARGERLDIVSVVWWPLALNVLRHKSIVMLVRSILISWYNFGKRNFHFFRCHLKISRKVGITVLTLITANLAHRSIAPVLPETFAYKINAAAQVMRSVGRVIDVSIISIWHVFQL